MSAEELIEGWHCEVGASGAVRTCSVLYDPRDWKFRGTGMSITIFADGSILTQGHGKVPPAVVDFLLKGRVRA